MGQLVKLLAVALPLAACFLADVGREYKQQVNLQQRYPTHDDFIDQGISVGPPARIHIAFCQNWQMRSTYQSVSSLVSQRFPGLEVVPTEMPLTPVMAAVVRAARWLHFALLGFALAGDKLLDQLGLPAPAWMTNLTQNKFSTCMGVWFIGNMVLQQLTASAAFEVYANGNLVYSHLNRDRGTGRALTAEELLAGITQALPSQ